jgi:hypothetical protein
MRNRDNVNFFELTRAQCITLALLFNRLPNGPGLMLAQSRGRSLGRKGGVRCVLVPLGGFIVRIDREGAMTAARSTRKHVGLIN